MNDQVLEPTPSKRALRAAQLVHRYGVDPRTITRWKDSGILPPPDLTINGIDYWFESSIEANERENLSARKRKRSASPIIRSTPRDAP